MSDDLTDWAEHGMPKARSRPPWTRADWVVAAVAGFVGLATWIVTAASAPRYSYGPEPQMGSRALFPVLLLSALIGGFAVPRRAWLTGLMLGLPPLLLSPWTAPRGDGDGLWVLIVPMLALFLPVLMGAAKVAAWLRGRIRPQF
jgi:hypothetical protein